ncbi:MAG: single-stranded DNA-binding protein [Actinomycetota bacterium]
MTDMITLTGLVATQPKHLVTAEGLSITSFRLASTQRRFDRSQERWIDGDTNWYTITTFRQLAINVVGSVHKGDRVIATGRLRIRDWTNGEKAGTTIEVDADAVGPDLLWGTSVFTRSISTAVADGMREAQATQATDNEEVADAEVAERAPEESLDPLAVPF